MKLFCFFSFGFCLQFLFEIQDYINLDIFSIKFYSVFADAGWRIFNSRKVFKKKSKKTDGVKLYEKKNIRAFVDQNLDFNQPEGKNRTLV